MKIVLALILVQIYGCISPSSNGENIGKAKSNYEFLTNEGIEGGGAGDKEDDERSYFLSDEKKTLINIKEIHEIMTRTDSQNFTRVSAVVSSSEFNKSSENWIFYYARKNLESLGVVEFHTSNSRVTSTGLELEIAGTFGTCIGQLQSLPPYNINISCYFKNTKNEIALIR